MEGVVLIALGVPYYAHMAYNLAVSIKYHGDIPIAIICNESLNQLTAEQRSIWSEVKIDLERLKRNGNVEYLKCKTLLYELSPYEKTIFLDADMILTPFKNFNDLFKLNGVVFANRGEVTAGGGKSQWVDVKDIFQTYEIDHWYDLSSEFIFFDRSELNKKLFEDSQKYYDDDSIPVVTFKEKNKEGKRGITMFAGGKPDEIPFGIAIEKNNIRFESPFLPSYWQPQYFNKAQTTDFIKKNFYMVSAGGAFVQSNIKRIYDDLTKTYFSKMKIKKTPYQLIAKRTVIPERSQI